MQKEGLAESAGVIDTHRVNLVFPLSRFFSQTKYPSFQRQLNLYGFNRFAHGVDKGAYYHFCFIKGHCNLVRNMIRRKIKGTKVRRTPTEEPNFYHPAWNNHFGSEVTDALKAVAYNVVPTPHKKAAAPQPLTTLTAPPAMVTSFVDILPAPSREMPIAAPVSDEESSWDSLDLDMIDSVADDLLMFEGDQFHFLEDFTPIGNNQDLLVDQILAPVAL